MHAWNRASDYELHESHEMSMCFVHICFDLQLAELYCFMIFFGYILHFVTFEPLVDSDCLAVAV